MPNPSHAKISLSTPTVNGYLKHWREEFRLEICSYALEILALVAAKNGTPRHPSKLVMACFDLLSADEFSTPIVLERYWKPEGRLRPGIYDPAVPNNNVTADLGAAERKKVASRARRSLEALQRATDYAAVGQIAKAEDRVLAAIQRG